MLIQLDIHNGYRVNDHIKMLKKITEECRMTGLERSVMIDTIHHFEVVKKQLDLAAKMSSDSMGEA